MIDTFGPSSIQPLVATRATTEALRRRVREIVIGLGAADTDREFLDQGLVDRFVAVDDVAYDDIRAMLESVERAGLSLG